MQTWKGTLPLLMTVEQDDDILCFDGSTLQILALVIKRKPIVFLQSQEKGLTFSP